MEKRQTFLTKFLFLRGKKKILKILKKFAFLIKYVLSLGILEATHVITFYIFAFVLQVFFFFLRAWSIDKYENSQIL